MRASPFFVACIFESNTKNCLNVVEKFLKKNKNCLNKSIEIINIDKIIKIDIKWIFFGIKCSQSLLWKKMLYFPILIMFSFYCFSNLLIINSKKKSMKRFLLYLSLFNLLFYFFFKYFCCYYNTNNILIYVSKRAVILVIVLLFFVVVVVVAFK